MSLYCWKTGWHMNDVECTMEKKATWRYNGMNQTTKEKTTTADAFTSLWRYEYTIEKHDTRWKSTLVNTSSITNDFKPHKIFIKCSVLKVRCQLLLSFHLILFTFGKFRVRIESIWCHLSTLRQPSARFRFPLLALLRSHFHFRCVSCQEMIMTIAIGTLKNRPWHNLEVWMLSGLLPEC